MMRRGNMFLVLMLVTTVLMVGSVQAVLKGNSIVGSGENDDPYTWNIGGIKGTIGLTEEGKLRQYDGGWKHLYNPKGDGSESNPYRFSDSDARGLAYKDLTLRKRVQISFRHEDKWGFRPPYILGDGTEGNPYRAGVSGMEEFGVTRFCEVMKKTAIGSWQMITDDMNTGAREYKGNGGINNPFKISDASDKGLYCYRGHGFVWVLLMYYYNGEWYFETPSVPVVRGSATAVGGGAAGSISVMTYNIRYGCGSAYECADFEYNIESISDLINGRKPYVLVIQELGKSGVRDKVENLELIKGHTKYRGRETDGNLAVLALLGSIEATEAKGYSNDETYFFYSRTPITIGDTKYVIYNTHLRRPPFVADFDENKPNNEQLKDLSKTRQQVKELAVAVE